MMTSNTIGVGTGLEAREKPANSSSMADNQLEKRSSPFAKQKSSNLIDESPAAIVEASSLNDADRRLAEMGYAQVGSKLLYFPCPADIFVSLGI